jgi:hypothetical protein
MWTPIIPNSQLIIFGNGSTTLNWGVELFISPTHQLYVIVIACAVCLVLIGIAIIIFHCKEKIEDKRNEPEFFL